MLLEMREIQKSFPGVHALDDCRFELAAGEVHALVGENGAGKSTLMKVLTGVYQKDSGHILIDGEEVHIENTRDAQALGISIIHQELNLMKDLTVAENIYIGRESMKGAFLNKNAQNQRAAALLEKLNIKLSPLQIVGELSVAKQQMVEIAKALSYNNTRILIMDEPSAALTETEIEDLFRFIRQLKEKGVGIVYISHRMGELKQITDRITVMRDGQYINTVLTKDVTLDEIIQMMVGRVIYEQPKTHSNVAPDAPVVLECKGLCSKDVKNVSFQLKKGEILGFAGLMGAGRTETVRLLYGADKRDAGEIFVNGKKVPIKTPADAVKAGIGYLSEDRKRFGLCLQLSVAHNTALPSLDELSGAVAVNDKKVRAFSDVYKKRIAIKTPTVDTQVRTLSGGNMQKVVVAKWLLRNCDILIFDEPTRGIDVGAKNEIYKLMNQLAEEGKSLIMISSEMQELLRMSDRIVVMCEGEKTGEMLIQDATQEKIMSLAASRK